MPLHPVPSRESSLKPRPKTKAVKGRRTAGARKAGHSSGASSRRARSPCTLRRTREKPRRLSQASPRPTRARSSLVNSVS